MGFVIILEAFKVWLVIPGYDMVDCKDPYHT